MKKILDFIPVFPIISALVLSLMGPFSFFTYVDKTLGVTIFNNKLYFITQTTISLFSYVLLILYKKDIKSHYVWFMSFFLSLLILFLTPLPK